MLEKESSAPLSSIETAREPVGLEQEWKYESTMIAEAHPLTLNELKASYRTMRIEISEDLKEEVTGDKKEKYFEIVVTGVYKRDTILLKSDEGSLEAFHSKLCDLYPSMPVEAYPKRMDPHRVDRLIFDFNRLFKYLVSLLDDTELLFLHDMCELLLEVLLAKHLKDRDSSGMVDLGQPKSARRHASLGDITESSFNRVRQMTQMREQDSFKIKNRSHSSALDREIERQLYNERIQLEQSKIHEVGKGMVKTKIDQFSWSYKLNKDKVPVVVRKAFYRPKTPLQVYYKLPDEEEWNLGFMVYVEARLYFGRSQSDMQADHLSFQEFVSIYDTEAELVDCSHPYIKFTRRYEYASLKVTTGFTPLEELNSFGSPHISASLEFLFFSLVFASTRELHTDPGEVLEYSGLARLNFNHLRLKVATEKDTERLRDQQWYLLIKAYPYSEYVKVVFEDEKHSLTPQLLYMPLNNWFRKIDISLVMAKNSTNLFNGKSTVVGNCSLLNYDILMSGADQEVKKPDEFVLDQNEKWLKDVKVNICYKNLSNFKTFFINPNTDHYLEGKRIYKDNLSFSRQEVKISSFRMMRVKNILEIYQERFYEVFRLRHLHWSIFIAVVFHLYVFLCDFNNLHLHFLYLVLIVMGCNYPAFRTLFVDSLFERLRSPKTQNPDFWEPLIHTKTYLKEHRYMQIDLLRKRLKPAEGLLTTMNSLYNKFNDAPFLIHKLVNVFEKLRNLLLWYEPRKSLYFLGFILFLIWVCYLIPLKILILLGFWGELNDQRNYYKRHYARNMQVASQAIRLIIAKTMDKYADISTDFSRELPFVANDSEFSNFRKKLNAKIDKHLDIELPDNLLQTMHKLDDLVHFLASTNERLKVLEPEILEFDNSKYKKKLNPFLLMMIGFVQTTPSDYFAIVNNKKI